MGQPLITFDQLSVGYNNQSVLSDISFSVNQSDFVAILGANGSGKSTLLKTLLGLQPALSGHLRISTEHSPLGFGYVPQTVQLDPLYPLTGFEVALMGTYGRVYPGHRVPRA